MKMWQVIAFPMNEGVPVIKKVELTAAEKAAKAEADAVSIKQWEDEFDALIRNHQSKSASK